jgi:hypothetical protein
MTSASVRHSELRESTRRLAQALTLLVLLSATRAFAQATEPVDLEWDAPRGCSSASAVRARVRKLVGPREGAGSALRAHAKITRNADGVLNLRLTVRVDDIVGERTIEGRSCVDLAGSAAVALALMLRSREPLTQEDLGSRAEGDAARVEAEVRSADVDTSEQAESAAAAQSRVLAATDPVAPPAPSSRGWRALLRLPFAALRFGPVPGLAFGVSAGAGLSIGHLRFAADLRLWLPRHLTTAGQVERYGADIRGYTTALQACRALFGPRFELAPCLLVAIEHISASGTGPHIAEVRADATWVAAGIGVLVRWNVARWLDLLAGIEVAFQTSRPTILIDDVGQVEQLLPVSFTVTLGSEWIL